MQDLDLFEGHEPDRRFGGEARGESAEPLFGVDDLDHQGQVARQVEDVGVVQPVGPANPIGPRNTVAPESPASRADSTIAS